jgi:hypothetical protein
MQRRLRFSRERWKRLELPRKSRRNERKMEGTQNWINAK